jgi:DNA-binding transcriptional LysR family regulator
MDRLLSMEVFVAVIESGSFTSAAEVFQISPPMVGKHIRDLEARLGARLLSRTTRRQSLTEIGQQYYARCKFILGEIKAAETGAEAMRGVPRGTLRVNAPVSFGSMQLAPLIGEYLAANPAVNLNLTLDDRLVDIVDEGYDAAIRIGTLADSGLIARRLAPYRMLICASPAYLERTGMPTQPADLAAHQCLDFTYWSKRGGWRLGRHEGNDFAPAGHRFRTNNGQALRMAALAGLGIVMQSEALLADDVRSGRLVEILQDFRPAPRPMQIVYPRDRQAVPKLTTFIEFMIRRFG